MLRHDMCLTVPDSVPGVRLLVSGGRSVLLVHKALLLTMNHKSWARVLHRTRMDPHFSALPLNDIRALLSRLCTGARVRWMMICRPNTRDCRLCVFKVLH
jgi:hypothetical protein